MTIFSNKRHIFNTQKTNVRSRFISPSRMLSTFVGKTCITNPRAMTPFFRWSNSVSDCYHMKKATIKSHIYMIQKVIKKNGVKRENIKSQFEQLDNNCGTLQFCGIFYQLNYSKSKPCHGNDNDKRRVTEFKIDFPMPWNLLVFLFFYF